MRNSITVFKADEAGKFQPVLGSDGVIHQVIEIEECGTNSECIIFFKYRSGAEKRVYLVHGITRQLFLWEDIAPVLNVQRSIDLAFFAQEWGIGLGELHDLLLRNHPW